MHHLLGGLVHDILCQPQNFERGQIFLLISPPNGLFKRKKKLDQNFEGGHTMLTPSFLGVNRFFQVIFFKSILWENRSSYQKNEPYLFSRELREL